MAVLESLQNASDVVDAAGRALRVWHEIESVTGDVVTVLGTTARQDGTVLRVDRASLRFLDPATLDAFLADAGFEVEARYGDWHCRVWHEAAPGELRAQLHLTAHQADALLDLAQDLAAKLPATSAALREGVIDLPRAQLVASRCSVLTPEEARAVPAPWPPGPR